MYNILPYSYKNAQTLGVKIKPSKIKNKKIDVYDFNNQLICSIGDIHYKDYPTYYITNGKEYAEDRRKKYWSRHKKDISKNGSKGYYSGHILW